ncbi:MAG: hypothetical protein HY898_14320 [Deltaproteobacteria bacterium]|nr:hypothetical protein [Deltaproteobacteria bacterium]
MPAAPLRLPPLPPTDRDDGIAIAVLRPMIAAREPAQMVARASPLAFITGFTMRAEPISGTCTFHVEGPIVRAYGSDAGLCKARIIALNEEETLRSIREMTIEVGVRAADGTLPRGSIAPTRDGIQRREMRRSIPTFEASNLEYAAPNAFTVKFKNGSGVRFRDGKIVLEPQAGEPQPPTQAFEEVLKALGTAKRYVALATWGNGAGYSNERRIDIELQQGTEAEDFSLWCRVYVDVASREQLAGIMNRLGRSGLVEHISPEHSASAPPPRPGPSTSKAPGPLSWPAKEDIEARERGVGPEAPYSGKAPPGKRPPVAKPPRDY